MALFLLHAEKAPADGFLVASHAVGALVAPLVDRLDLTEFLFAVEHADHSVVQVDVDVFLLVPPAEALVGALEQLEVGASVVAGLFCRGVVVIVVDFLPKDHLMHAHGFLVLFVIGVEFGQESEHLDGDLGQRTEDAAHVVADVFEEVNGRVVVAVDKADFGEATADVQCRAFMPA